MKILPRYALVSFIIISHSAQVVADDGNSGFISIDCGAGKDYIDEQTGISYQTDENFIESGTNHEVSPSFRFNDRPYIQRQLNTLRSFPEGERNCYTLKLNPEIIYQKQKYLIRAIFAYQNYDYRNQRPKFDVYLGVNFWTTVQLVADDFTYVEVTIQHVNTDLVQVCLVDTGEGTPFINSLELRPLNKSLYSSSFPLSLYTRRDCGQRFNYVRYKDDLYDRLWRIYDTRWDILETSEQVKLENSTYELPSEILLTACQPQNNSNLLTENWSFNIPEQVYLFLHFAEIEKLPSGQKRIINVTFDDDDENSLSQELTLEYLKPITLISNMTTRNASFKVRTTADSYASPILNAFEIFKVFPQPNSPIDTQDVNAMMEIKSTYGVSKISWQGDPCVPSNFVWEGVRCNSGNNTRIVSLNLNSSKLTGQIAQTFTRLEKLESLDLSNNELTGELPEFLATLPNLRFLDVTGNKLTGSIPKALRENANLQLSFANNPDLCESDSCDKERKFVIPLVTSVAVLVLIAILSMIIWRLRKKRQDVDLSTKSLKMEVPKQKGREFSYSQVLRITENFKALIGEGGFGKVYLGTLEDDSQVAVKLLSPTSKQGYKEFQSEAQLLTVIHHRNLVSLIGYCHENNIMALIYEYMDNGDLGLLLSEKNSNVLKWNERLQVAIDTAKGLEYLHTGCSTPIIHRDLKPSNILLNKSMIAKIADFGLSRVFTDERNSHLSTQPAGTPGYIDPEFQRSGQVNKKSDVYSFGMILFQLITGRPPIKRGSEDISFILDWIHPKIECVDIEAIVDPRLASGFHVSSTWRAIEVALSCVLPTPSQRPNISYILQELQECLALEMDQARIDNMTSSSHDTNVNSELITLVYARFQRPGQLNKKSDIYSLGMILLQLITGHPPIKRELENTSFILVWVQPTIESGDIESIVDPRFDGEFHVSSSRRAIEVALSCVLPTPSQRPDIITYCKNYKNV